MATAHLASKLWRQGDLLIKQLPQLLTLVTPYANGATLAHARPTLSSHQLGASWMWAAMGVFGAGAALHMTARAETTVGDSYAQPRELKGVPKEVILYQYEVCPFCCKVKAFLDYHKIPYRTVEVSPLTKEQLKWSDYRKVPVALLDREQVVDSTAIITRLAAELAAQQRSEQPPAPARRGWLPFGRGAQAQASGGGEAGGSAGAADEERWRRWVDKRLVRLLTVNIYRSAHEAFQTFDYIAETGKFNWAEREAARVVGAVMMWGISGRLKKKYAIDGDVRQQLYEAADAWVDAVGERSFHGGTAPDLADVSVFGVIRSVTCTDTFMDLMHHSRIGAWYERMMAAVGDSSRLSAT